MTSDSLNVKRFSPWTMRAGGICFGDLPSGRKIKETNFQNTKWRIGQILTDLYHRNAFLLEGDFLSDAEKAEYESVRMDMPEVAA